MADEGKTIAIAGAGSIGCYVGGGLALAGRKVNLLGRGRIVEAMQSPDGETPFSVRRASDGMVIIENTVPGVAALLNVEGLGVETHADMKAVQWSKLLMNLNNALVALSNLPLATELADRGWRVILADQLEEALAAMEASGIVPARIAGPPTFNRLSRRHGGSTCRCSCRSSAHRAGRTAGTPGTGSRVASPTSPASRAPRHASSQAFTSG